MHYHSIARTSLLLYPLLPLFYLSDILTWWQDTWCVTVRSPMAYEPFPLLTNQTANDNRPSHFDLLLLHLSLITISVPWNSGAYILRGYISTSPTHHETFFQLFISNFSSFVTYYKSTSPTHQKTFFSTFHFKFLCYCYSLFFMSIPVDFLS